MADPVWFYARGEVERGPFTLPQIRALANASKLRPDDLVWKEGMENWTAARHVAELFPAAGLIGDPSGSNGMGISAEARSAPTDSAARGSSTLTNEMRDVFRRVVRALTFLGAVLVVGTYGCETLSARRVTRLAAIAEISALDKSPSVSEEKQVATRATLNHQASAFTRAVALQMGLLVLLAGAIGLMMFADRYERWLGVGVILVVIFSALRTLNNGG